MSRRPLSELEEIEREIEECSYCQRTGNLCKQHKAELEQAENDEASE